MAGATWKRDVASGLIVCLPVLVSYYVISYLYGVVASVPFVGLLAAFTLEFFGLPADEGFVTLVTVVMTILIFAISVFVIGYLMRTAFGELFGGRLDDTMNQVPGLRVVYNASKMAVRTALQGTDELRTPVKLEPWDNGQMTAFKTGKSAPDGRHVLFLPTAPNITSGFVIEVEPDDYRELDERIEESLTRILSGGFGDTGPGPIPDPSKEPESDGEVVDRSGEPGRSGGDDRTNEPDRSGEDDRSGRPEPSEVSDRTDYDGHAESE